MARTSRNEEWFEAQKQYWDQWFEAQKSFMDTQARHAAAAQDQWAEFFAAWQQGISGENTPPHAAAFKTLFAEAGSRFLDMMEQFRQATGQDRPPEEAAREWLDSLKGFMNAGLYAGAPGNVWRRHFHSANPFAKATPFFGGTAFDPFGFAASMPGLGYTREKQEEWAELYERFSEYERMSQEYMAAMTRVGLEALEKFQAYIMNPPKDAPPLTSLKDIYVKWVDVCEDVYAEYAMTEEYTAIYGDTVNALMAFRKKLSEVMDDALAQFNLPTRAELDTLHALAHRLRRENIRIRKEMEELENRVFGAPPPPGPAAPPPRPAKKRKAAKAGPAQKKPASRKKPAARKPKGKKK